jgi:hypothetical protein
MNIRRVILPLLLALTTSTLSAQSISSTLLDPQIDTLFEQGDFVVTRELFPDDYPDDRNACVAEVTSVANPSLKFHGYEEGTIEIIIKNSDWELKDRDVVTIVDVDNTKWLVDAIANSYINAVTLNFEKDPSLAPKIMNAVSKGDLLIVKTYSGNSIGEFSISESRAAMFALSKCWTELKTVAEPSKDPFSEEADAQVVAKPSKPEPFYIQDLEGVYSQEWVVRNVYHNSHRHYSADIKGDGKLGRFAGKLLVNCGTPNVWEWTSINRDLFLNERSVPDRALIALSAYVCRDE